MRITRDRHRRWLCASAILCVALTLGLRADEPKIEPPRYNQMSDAQEVALGREAAAGIEKEKNLSIITIPAVQNYVAGITGRIAKESRRPQLTYTVKVVDDMSVNAFALPGGFLYVNRGLIEWARTESELAAVVSHEVGHVVGRHGANNISRFSTLDSLLTEASTILLGNALPALMLKQLGGPVAFLALMKYSRTDELQADLLGFYNLQRAGWSPDGMVDLFKHFGEGSTGIESMLAIANSHPAPADREAQIVAELKQFPAKAGLARDSDELKSVQAELKKLPKPKPAGA